MHKPHLSPVLKCGAALSGMCDDSDSFHRLNITQRERFPSPGARSHGCRWERGVTWKWSQAAFRRCRYATYFRCLHWGKSRFLATARKLKYSLQEWKQFWHLRNSNTDLTFVGVEWLFMIVQPSSSSLNAFHFHSTLFESSHTRRCFQASHTVWDPTEITHRLLCLLGNFNVWWWSNNTKLPVASRRRWGDLFKVGSEADWEKKECKNSKSIECPAQEVQYGWLPVWVI